VSDQPAYGSPPPSFGVRRTRWAGDRAVGACADTQACPLSDPHNRAGVYSASRQQGPCPWSLVHRLRPYEVVTDAVTDRSGVEQSETVSGCFEGRTVPPSSGVLP
jgi:hypothetical protein